MVEITLTLIYSSSGSHFLTCKYIPFGSSYKNERPPGTEDRTGRVLYATMNSVYSVTIAASIAVFVKLV